VFAIYVCTATMMWDRLHVLSCLSSCQHRFLIIGMMKWARCRLFWAEHVCGNCSVGVGDELHMVAECPGYAVVRELNSALIECVGGLPGLLNRPITSEQLGVKHCRSSGKWVFLYMTVLKSVAESPAYLMAPVQGITRCRRSTNRVAS
jgi:hypothetical protein